jgi:hypothetical protein
MVADWITALAATGASTLVSAAATDGWRAARSGFARLFGRGDLAREQLTAARLDALVRDLDDPDHDGQARAWATRLADLLEEHPSAANELRSLIDQLATYPTVPSQMNVQTNTAQDHATQYNVQNGSIHHPSRARSNPA